MDRFTEDNRLPAAADFLGDLLDLAEPPTMPDNEVVTYTDSLEVGMPVEMNLLSDAGGNFSLGMAPPTQTTQTSVFPVLHYLKLRVVANKNA